LILLDFAEIPPAEADGTWIQSYAPHKDVHLYPYEL
jgi:hypothetical protein